MADGAKQMISLNVIRLLLVFCLSSLKFSTNAEKILRMANLVYRHGDRSAIRSYPSDPYANYWPQGFGQLTQLGMQQEYYLGKFLRNRYMESTNFLNSSYIRNQVYCRSTDKDRTIMSAQAQLNGLYPPKGPQEWRHNLDWQPIPVHVVPKNLDRLLYFDVDCLVYSELMDKAMKSASYKRKEAEYKDLLSALGPHTGRNGSLDLTEAWNLHDTLFCQKCHNLTLPEWVTDSLMGQLANISQFMMMLSIQTDEMARLKGGPLLGEFVKNMRGFANAEDGVRKVYIYSAHDITVMTLLAALKLNSGMVPAYSSALMVELYEDKENRSEPTVQIHYRYGQSNKASQLIIPGCTADCPLNQFISLTEKMIPQDIDAECGLKDKTCVKTILYKSFLLAFALTLGILIFMTLTLCCCWCARRRSRSRAEHVKFDDGLLKNASLLGNQDYDSDS